MKIFVSFISILALVTSCTPCKTSWAEPNLILLNKIYCHVDGIDLTMDVYFPSNVEYPNPAIIYVHGGGWSQPQGEQSEGLAKSITTALKSRGFVSFWINYRLYPDATFPAMIEDVKCAVRSIRAHAIEYNIDPEKIGAWGGSAGGHLVSLLGTSDPESGFDVGEYTEYSSRVKAVVDMFGPTDLSLVSENEIIQNVFDDYDLEKASPIMYASSDDPRFLIFHGDQDILVPLEHSIILYEELSSAQVPVELIIVEKAGHGFFPGEEIAPSLFQIIIKTVSFFEKTLR